MAIDPPPADASAEIERLVREARAALKAKDLGLSEQLCNQILAIHPPNLRAKTILGFIAGQTGRMELAIKLLRQVVQADPRAAEATFYLATDLRMTGQIEEAIGLCKRLIELAPNMVDGHASLGLCYKAARRPVETAACFEHALKLDPSVWSFHFEIGLAMLAQNRPTEAERSLRRAIELSPLAPAPRIVLGKMLVDDGRKKEAAPIYRRLHELERDRSGSLMLLAQATLYEGDPNGAESILRQIIQEFPRAIPARMTLGLVLRELGRFDEAAEVCREVIELDPSNAVAFFDLSQGKKMKEDDRPVLRQMKRLLQSEGLGLQDRINLHYALGKSLDDLGEYGEAMSEFDEANALMSKFNEQAHGKFDGAEHVRHTDFAIRAYGKEFMDRVKPFGSESELPVLVVGMIRSGTTLVEQILSRHPEVGAGGESKFWMRPGESLSSPDGVLFSPEHIRSIADAYLERLAAAAPDARRITDKMPLNYRYIGVIHSVFPNARIIHCRRHPVDNCVSIYVTPF